jgi:hypothetical protein
VERDGHVTRAYKFLRPGAVAPFTAVSWPQPRDGEPGAWIETAAVEPCRRGVHACTREDLPYWLQDELWEIELDGDVQRVGHKLVAQRGRLVRRIAAWNDEAARAFSRDCAGRAASYAKASPDVAGHAADATSFADGGRAAVTGFIASRAAELSGGVEAYDAERAAQVAWLTEHLALHVD